MTDLPAWARLKNELAEGMRTGKWKPGEKLPSERDLAAGTGFSVGTVRKALESLVREGLCYRSQGRGTFVTAPPADLAVFFRMSTAPLNGDSFDILPTSIERTSEVPPAEVSAALGMAPGTECIRIRRVLHGRRMTSDSGEAPAGTVLLGISESWFPPVLCRRLAALPAEEFRSRSIYSLLKEECGHPMAACEEWISIAPGFPEGRLPSAESAGREPCLVMNMLSFTSDHRPLEYRTSYVAVQGKGLLRRHQLS